MKTNFANIISRLAAPLILCLALLCTSGCGAVGSTKSGGEAPAIVNEESVIEAIRAGLKGHAARIHVALPYSPALKEDLSRLTKNWMEQAMSETDDPTEGDYIRYQTGGYSADSSKSTAEDGTERIMLTITPEYYLYLAQEEEASAAMSEIMAGLGLDAMSERERVRAVYDWVCNNVGYDRVHLGNKYYTLRSTMYAALVQGEATCQGYAVTLYRMLREASVPCRVVTGTGTRTVVDASGAERETMERHAWNIVFIDGEWYGLDATWDAGRDGDYLYFLVDTDDFSGHLPDSY